MKKFLTAEWRDLVMANYEVDPAMLLEFVPDHCKLDLHQGKCFASLVAFKFLKTRVLGIPIPFHTDFEEVNLRFYVTHRAGDELRRGVVFVKEIVPKAAITFIARTFYGEPYETWEMSHLSKAASHEYSWSKDGSNNRILVETGKNEGIPSKGSHAEFIIEHYWGYTARGNGRTDEYKVEHPKWDVFDIEYAEIDVDFGSVYGSKFGYLKETEPFSILMARGSAISVYKGEKIQARNGRRVSPRISRMM